MPTALVTGSTGGIGRAIAEALARRGYTVHLLGRRAAEGQVVLDSLRADSPNLPHRFFRVDLATVATNKAFIEAYSAEFDQLDLLVLNALALSPRGSTTDDGLDLTAAVGVLSRYMFSVGFDPLLRRAGGRVVHNGTDVWLQAVDLDRLTNGGQRALAANATTYSAGARLVQGYGPHGLTDVPHVMFYPGTVATDQLGWVGKLPAWLLSVFTIWQPEAVGAVFADMFADTEAGAYSGHRVERSKLKKLNAKGLQDKPSFDRLLEWTASKSGMAFEPMAGQLGGNNETTAPLLPDSRPRSTSWPTPTNAQSIGPSRRSHAR